jgi:4'-phosphopantetheinyl transferase
MVQSLPWLAVDGPLSLAADELHLWRASLDIAPDLLQRFEKTLSETEKERADRFLVPHARERFIAGRGILRELLGTYLGAEPGRIVFSYGQDGKPSLSPAHESKIRFSISHSKDMALYAMAKSSEVGIDIEEVKAGFRGMEIASHFFSEEEISALAALSSEAAGEAFFSCWTKKEAYVKALGQGLGIPLQSFTVKFAESEQVLRDAGGVGWSCYGLEPAPGFLGAVVVAGADWRLKYFDWSRETSSLAR